MNSKTTTNLTIIVLGLDADGKPRAAVYPADMLEMATEAAAKWKLRLAKAESDAAQALAKDLPNGTNFPSNKFEAPTVKRETYNLLLKTVTTGEPSSPPKTAAAPAVPSINPWDAIEVGSTVLYCQDKEEGYFPATVTGVSGDKKSVTLKWIGYPKLESFRGRRLACGLLAIVKQP